jgi:SAM-dependent methyltransferase
MGPEQLAARRRLARRLEGSGIDLGPGQAPFRPPGARVRSVDRWDPDRRLQILGALGDEGHPGGNCGSCTDDPGAENARVAEFTQPDVIADFNTERLGAFGDESEDFVIASHVIEHLAEPIGFIDEIHRVLRRGGLALVLLPDRHRTRDRFRTATPLAHLVEEYRSGVTEVSDAHLVEFLRDRGGPLKTSGEERRRTLDLYREQSIHVHCWDAQEFVDVLLWGIEHLGHQWELVDACLYEPPVHFEFGYLLRRAEDQVEPHTRREQFERAWTSWLEAQLARRPSLLEVRRNRLPAWAYRAGRRLNRHPLVGRARTKADATARSVRRRAKNL